MIIKSTVPGHPDLEIDDQYLSGLTKMKIIDSGKEHWDRYTVFPDANSQHSLSISRDANKASWCKSDYGYMSHIYKEVLFSDLPENIQRIIQENL